MRKKKKKNNAKQNEEVIRRYSCQSVQKCDIGVKKNKNAFKFSKKKKRQRYIIRHSLRAHLTNLKSNNSYKSLNK